MASCSSSRGQRETSSFFNQLPVVLSTASAGHEDRSSSARVGKPRHSSCCSDAQPVRLMLASSARLEVLARRTFRSVVHIDRSRVCTSLQSSSSSCRLVKLARSSCGWEPLMLSLWTELQPCRLAPGVQSHSTSTAAVHPVRSMHPLRPGCRPGAAASQILQASK